MSTARLTTLARAIHARLESATPSPVDVPVPSPTATKGPQDPVPAGFLQLADLGTTGNWSHTNSGGDTSSSPGLAVNLPTCPGHQTTTVRGPSQFVMYRGTLDGGDGEWIVGETIVTLTPGDGQHARDALAAVTCSRIVKDHAPVAHGGNGVVVIGHPLPSGEPSYSTAYVVAGNKLVQVDTLPGGAAGGVAIPGGMSWFIEVAERATTRAAS
jgi:hypothetical protein